MSREIDCLVAERVMGWKWFTRHNANTYWLGTPTDANLDSDVFSGKVVEVLLTERGWKECESFDHIPYYSTNLQDAWSVLEKICIDNDWRCIMDVNGKKYTEVTFKNQMGGWRGGFAEKQTAPMAICLAALDVVDKANSYE
ncbi:BC1872 family protein [Peribacillus muralis]|uniref:BC1872 family protein n=1 Tax=Peribacillus muralis TaxID=264697 RepID=UPI003D004791